MSPSKTRQAGVQTEWFYNGYNVVVVVEVGLLSVCVSGHCFTGNSISICIEYSQCQPHVQPTVTGVEYTCPTNAGNTCYAGNVQFSSIRSI